MIGLLGRCRCETDFRSLFRLASKQQEVVVDFTKKKKLPRWSLVY
jgi:hypothetical protein